MDLQAEKLQIIEWVARLNDKAMIKKLVSLKHEKEKDWWNEISQDEKDEIDEGLKQADRGETIEHEKFMKKYKKWL